MIPSRESPPRGAIATLWSVSRSLQAAAICVLLAAMQPTLSGGEDAETQNLCAGSVAKVSDFLRTMVGEYDVCVEAPREGQRPAFGVATAKLDMADTALVIRTSVAGRCVQWTLRSDESGKSITCWWFDAENAEISKLSGQIQGKQVTLTGHLGTRPVMLGMLLSKSGFVVSRIDGISLSSTASFRAR